MNGILLLLLLAVAVATVALVPGEGSTALLVCIALAAPAGIIIRNSGGAVGKELTQLFVMGLSARLAVALVVFTLELQSFFGADAYTYDALGHALAKVWQGEYHYQRVLDESMFGTFQGMPYVVAVTYSLVGRNMLAVQFVNAVLGAATAPVIYLCAEHIFQNLRVARAAGRMVALFPSLVLWSSQGLKDGPIIFLLALAMLATLRLGQEFSPKHFAVLVGALFGILSMRFYIFYMMTAAVAGAFIVGMRGATTQSLMRRCMVILGMGLAMTYLGVLRKADEQYRSFGNLQAVQVSRSDLAQSAQSGFGQDVDVSTTSGALSTIPLGMAYLLLAPFPWQMANLRQSITLPEMIFWWGSLPLLVLGLWFTLKYRLRQALPILMFTSMLTLAYSVFQGNVGTAYRQRSQLLIFYFIFVAVGYVLLREKSEDRKRTAQAVDSGRNVRPGSHQARR